LVYSGCMSAGEKLSESELRPAYLDEFERKFAAALTQQPDARKTRFGATRSSDANVEVPSSPSLSEAVAPGSIGAEQPAKVEQASSKTRNSTARATNASLQADSANVESDGALDVDTARPTGPLLDLAETLSTVRALKSPAAPPKSSATLRVSDKVTQAGADEAPPTGSPALPDGNGNEPKQETEAASTAERTVDVEAWPAEVEAGLANEVAQEPASLHAQRVAKVIERFSRDWKLMAGACAVAGVAIVGAVALPRAMLALPNPPPGADERSVRDSTTRDDSAPGLKDSALAAEDRSGAHSEGALATASAPKSNEAPAVAVDQASVGLANLAPTGSTSEISDPMGPASPVSPAAQPTGVKPVPAVLTASAAASLATPAQSADFKPAPAVSPQPAPAPTPATAPTTLPTEGASADHAARPATKPVRNINNIGMAKLSARRGDASKKVLDTPSIGASVTKNDATSTEKSNQPLPVGTPTNLVKAAIASNVVQSPSPPPAASAQQPFDDPTRGMSSGAVSAPYPFRDGTTAKPNSFLSGTPSNLEKAAIASDVVKSPSPPASDPGPSAQQPLDHPVHPMGRGAVSRQYLVDSKPHDGSIEKPSQSLPVGMKGAVVSNASQPAAGPVAAVPPASDQPLDRLRRATGGISATGAAQAQHSVDSTSRDPVIEKQGQPLPVATPANHDNAGGEPKPPQAAPISAAAMPAAQPSGLY
jgi:hypothetical protein